MGSAMPLPETAASSFSACTFANSLAELLAHGNLSFCFPSGRRPPPFVDGAFFTSSLAACEASASATATCDPLALRLTAQLLDSFLALPLHRVSRGAASSPFALRGRRVSAACLGRCWARLADRLNAWAAHPPVGVEEMGRAAGKVEKIEQQLSALHRAAEDSTLTLPSLAPAQDGSRAGSLFLQLRVSTRALFWTTSCVRSTLTRLPRQCLLQSSPPTPLR